MMNTTTFYFAKRVTSDVLEGVASKNILGASPQTLFSTACLSDMTILAHTFLPIEADMQQINASSSS